MIKNKSANKQIKDVLEKYLPPDIDPKVVTKLTTELSVTIRETIIQIVEDNKRRKIGVRETLEDRPKQTKKKGNAKLINKSCLTHCLKSII